MHLSSEPQNPIAASLRLSDISLAPFCSGVAGARARTGRLMEQVICQGAARCVYEGGEVLEEREICEGLVRWIKW